ncbi:MAG: DUF1838 family protein [Steroidobacteraceae bacterium]
MANKLPASALIAFTALVAVATQAEPLDIYTADGALAAMRKVQCSMVDGEAVTYYWHGETYSRVPGEADRKLFDVIGMNIRACATINDPQRGKGWRLVSRELLIYVDPATGEPLTEWNNPWTGAAVKVVQTANDPVNQPPLFPLGRDGKPVSWRGTVSGDQWWQTLTVPLFYRNPLGGDYQKYIGGTYHATEMFNFFGPIAALTDQSVTSAPVQVGWVRISGWLPWMEMGDRSGLLYFHSAGRKLGSWDELPEAFRSLIERDYPLWKSPPPLDDKRPNETSWTYFRKQVAPEAPPARH